MTRMIVFAALFLVAARGQAPSPLDLTRALQLAGELSSPQAADISVAQARLAWLEASRGRRVEITPQMAMWSAASPLSLVSSLGGSLLGSNQNVSSLTLLEARIDLASAENAAQARRLEREAQVTELYLALAVRQDMRDRTCKAVVLAQQRRDQTKAELVRARATRLDLGIREQEALEREADCSRGEEDRRVAAIALASALHLKGDDMRVGALPAAAVRQRLVTAGELYELAQTYRDDLTSVGRLKDRVVELGEELESVRDGQMRLVLKDNGAFEAQKRVVAERLRRLNLQVEELEWQVRARILELRVRSEALSEQLEFAERRVALVQGQNDVVAARFKAGLATRADVSRAEDVNRAADMKLAELRHQHAANAIALLSICGLADRPVRLQAQIYEPVWDAALR